MSTSCTSASAASSSLARAASCGASLYASINLHTTDVADMRRGEDDDTLNGEPHRSALHHHTRQRVGAKLLSPTSSRCRNKRKNFQPRNIRPGSGSPDNEDGDDGEDDQDDSGFVPPDSEESPKTTTHLTAASSPHDVDPTSTKSFSTSCERRSSRHRQRKSVGSFHSSGNTGTTSHSSRSGSEISRSSSTTSSYEDDDDDDIPHRAETLGCHPALNISDSVRPQEVGGTRKRSTSRSSGHSREEDDADEVNSRESSTSAAAVDLSVMGSSNRPMTTTTTSSASPDFDDDNSKESATAQDVKMKSWMLVWQQQQQQQGQQSGAPSRSVGPASAESPPSRPDVPSALVKEMVSAAAAAAVAAATKNSTQRLSEADVAAMNEYAENTVRELLGLYGVPRDAVAHLSKQLPNGGFLAPFSSTSGRAGSPLANHRHTAAGSGSLGPGAASTPSSAGQQPPTPPHTPQTAINSLSSILGRPSVDPVAGGTELLSLHSHVQSMLKAGGSGRQTSDSLSPSVYPKALMEGNHGAVELSSRMAPFIGLNFHLEAKTIGDVADSPDPSDKVAVPVDMAAASSGVGGRGGSKSAGGNNKNNAAPIDYSRYVKRFASAIECGSPNCKDLNYREHFHCLDCHPRVFVKKEEMIRHFKWHKKRDESLQHGFMRYSPGDDCNDRYRGCPHNRKQTHYHCVKSTCDKVYISTSDVQMHANYHRKDSAIIQEGFQRFRATEDCATPHCLFNGQRTTHFHCIRPPCNYTFKNKADMEKHKSYHVKDEQLARDGFKKFMKNEECQFDNCRFSRVCNHIHCIRDGCNYVLHSSGQLYSHKRKHERRDAELALGGSGANNSGNSSNMIVNNDSNSSSSFSAQQPAASQGAPPATSLGNLSGSEHATSQSPFAGLSPADLTRLMSDPALAAFLYGRMSQLEVAHLQHQQQQQLEQLKRAHAAAVQQQQQRHQQQMAGRSPSPVMSEDDAFRLCMARYDFGKPCQLDCQIHPQEHYHCRSDGCCGLTFKSTEAAKEHWRNHEQQDHITDNYFISVDIDEEPNPCPPHCPHQTRQRHFHCCWNGCSEIVLSTDKPFRRLDHYKMHEFSRRGQVDGTGTPVPASAQLTPSASTSSGSAGFQRSPAIAPLVPSSPIAHAISNLNAPYGGLTGHGLPSTSPTTAFSLDSMFRRKRGRPPKNRVIEVWNESPSMSAGAGGIPDTPQAIFTSFKLPKPTTPPLVPPHGNSCGAVFPSPHAAPSLHHPLNSSQLAASGRSSTSSSPSSGRVMTKGGRPTLSPNSPEYPESVKTERNSDKTDAKSPHRQSHHRNVSPSSGAVAQGPSSVLRSPESPVKSTTVIKAAGTFYPLSAFPSKSDALIPPAVPPTTATPSSSSVSPSCTTTSSSLTCPSQPCLPTGYRVEESSSPPPASSSSLSPSPTPSASPTAVAAHLMADKPMAYGPDQSCGRPFCKLKRKEHYHCVVCNQAFSEVDKLKPHMMKHCTGALSPTMNQWINSCGSTLSSPSLPPSTCESIITPTAVEVKHEVEPGDTVGKEELARLQAFAAKQLGPLSLLNAESAADAARSSAALHALSFMSPMGNPFGLPHGGGSPASFLPPGLQSIYANTSLLLGHHGTLANFGAAGSNSSVVGHGANNKRPSPIDQLMLSPEAKKMRYQTNVRILKDEPVPEGYVRFRFNEDCQYSHCGYREHQTHFHCMRPDCGYSFCDKTRFVQHTARHERLDTLMGEDFQQYRANVGCGRTGCIYTASLGAVQNKASHFHCLKCDFVCTDTNKVVAHRRQHQKTDSIMAAGFEKFTPSQNCRVDNCPHSNKQTHYHCLKCSYAVLGLAQMSAHKYRHLESASTS